MARRPRGELKEMILDATDRLLFAAGNVQAVSIDAVVEAVDCTPPALYYYFPTKERLVLEACRRQFERFAEELEAALPETDDPLVELRGRGHAYLDWGVGHPEHYRVLFMTPRAASRDDDVADPTEASGLAELIDNLARAVDAGLMRQSDPLEMALAFWSTVHGITSLAITIPALPMELSHGVLDVTTDAVIQRYAA